MGIDWDPLRAELALWRRAALPLPLWWRDDDAVSATPALERLSALAEELALPVHLAVIPAFADRSLARAVADTPLLRPTVHGWAHENRAPRGEKKAEFGAVHADTAELLGRGLDTLRDLFGHAIAPAFVAPWNRLHGDVPPHLAMAGYRAVSTFAPRPTVEPLPGLVQVNAHIDPIDWHGTRSLVAPDRIVARTVATLQDRRQGRADPTEPLGYLTHHLVHDADIWSFSRELLTELLEGGAVSRPLTDILKDPP
ncbi:polysaccharide deacetylase family protein [Roseobacter sinensis]|uniref:Polysaccharide deacetylase family protein n=1 Tax=Roseobacter sinensis TaxID=2931391 RepID=A0ABT3BB85_9RHOB|nr:polysaccharide deacetylase family protein [Roseobacter sp. WL0113]MCV3270812.1 polysaccharide deacetylase family protein [Roseobacter sp. WL0113]